jgi:hypothetical protein
MTYQTPHGWRVTARGPLHAASAGSPAYLRLRLRLHKALRLFVAAGAWGAGLCLIIASVALVAEASGSGSPDHVTATSRAYHLKQGGPADRQAPSQPIRVTLARFAGTGGTVTRAFRVASASRWQLTWSYHCAEAQPAGQLQIRQGGAAGGGLIVSAAGRAARGSTWTYSTASTHYLVVTTGCAWTIEVAGHR